MAHNPLGIYMFLGNLFPADNSNAGTDMPNDVSGHICMLLAFARNSIVMRHGYLCQTGERRII